MYPQWYNVITYGTTLRCTQIAINAYDTSGIPRGTIFVRTQHDSVVSGWVRYVTNSELPMCQVVTLPITNSKHFTLTFERDVELFSIQNAGIGYTGEISVVGWTKTNGRNYEIYLSASFSGNGSFAITYK